jgi:hypothetical protein
MRISLYLAIAACLAGMGVVLHGAILSSRDPGFVRSNPDALNVTDDGFVSDYFNLSYRVPDGWAGGLAGPPPSQSGYYVLGTWAPKNDFAGAILVTAQDMFFEPDASNDMKSVITQFRQVMSTVDGMTIDREPAQVDVAGRLGYRVDFSGVGLFRSMIAIEIRCHVVMFNLTTRDPESLASLAGSLDSLVSVRKQTSDAVPECVKDYASDNVVQRVEPQALDIRPASVPVRLIVAADGSVKHVHVIHGSQAQQRNIEAAVGQWKFKPYAREGHPVAVETGMVLNLKPASM